MPYDHAALEKKWQTAWDAAEIYAAKDADPREKYYVLVEFPYPSGDGLHVGHCRSYTALDIVARKKRMEGKNVLFPIGFDAFGLPTENYAIKHKIHPRAATDKNIANFTRQLKSVGFSFDWARVIDTTGEGYYRWTQWLFLQFLKKGLAYQAEIPINWCPSCKIGLANEEVVEGNCERCGTKTERRRKKQWMLAITKYAERLLNDLETVDYLPRVRAQQQNWIGKSEGAEIEFAFSGVTQATLIKEYVPHLDADCRNLFFVTWNTVSDAQAIHGSTTDHQDTLNGAIHGAGATDNDPESQTFTPGAKLIDSTEKAKVILQAFAEAQAKYGQEFQLLEAVVVENHVHAIMAIPDESRIEIALNKLKGISSRRFWQAHSRAINGSVKNDSSEQHASDSAIRQTTLNGAIHGAAQVTHETCHHLWRTGYHYTRISSLTEYERTITYIREHTEKSTISSLYSEVPLTLTVFTTRADTLFGCTYVVLAPEHPLVQNLKSEIQNYDEVVSYIAAAAKKSDLERTELNKSKTGVELKGVRAINPVNGEHVPVWIADYVLSGYGTGAVMAVPAHDERDFAFAQKMGLAIKKVIVPTTPSSRTNERSECDPGSTAETLDPDVRRDDEKNTQAFTDDGTLVHSSEFNNLSSADARKQIVAKLEQQNAGRATINFKLRDWVFSRQRYWGEPIPVVHCPKCGVVPLPESELPLKLPNVEKYEPTDNGDSPLAAITDWVNTKCPTCGGAATRETDTMPNWAGSSWYFLRYTDPRNDTAFADRAKLEYWTPVDLYNGGMEHTVLHLLYSRFWHKFIYDLGLVPTAEPYKKRISHGMILGPDGEKMSKSRGNVINPDDIVREHGADTLRVYEMFIGPFDQAAAWSEGGVAGVRRFLDRVHKLFTDADRLEPHPTDGCPLSATPAFKRQLHRTIKKVTEDIDGQHFNTAVSQMMIFVNFCTEQTRVPQQGMEKFLKLLAPFAPHLAEELWATSLGHTSSITTEAWPAYDPALIADTEITLVVSVNGKPREELRVAATIEKDAAIAAAKASEKVAKWLDGKKIVKEIYVPGKLVNLVVQ